MRSVAPDLVSGPPSGESTGGTGQEVFRKRAARIEGKRRLCGASFIERVYAFVQQRTLLFVRPVILPHRRSVADRTATKNRRAFRRAGDVHVIGAV